jgi:alkylated DNA nucleotide flippase Atl1
VSPADYQVSERCIHGMDVRFCAVCNRATFARRGGAPSPSTSNAAGPAIASLTEVLEFLNAEKVRATYGAVAALVGLNARSVGAALQDPRVEASWVVNADTGLPTGYAAYQMHPDLVANPLIIRTATELQLRFALWKGQSTRRD